MKLNSSAVLGHRLIYLVLAVICSLGLSGQGSVQIQGVCEPCTSIGLDIIVDKTTICSGEKLTLKLEMPNGPPSIPTAEYIQWSTGQTMTDSIVVKPSVTTTYYVTYKFPGNCEETASVEIEVGPHLNLNRKTVIKTDVSSDSLWCKNLWADSLLVIRMNPDSLPTGNYTYQWSDGTTADTLGVNPDTSKKVNIYYVDISQGGFCYRDSIVIKIIDCPCAGDPLNNMEIASTTANGLGRLGGTYGCTRFDASFMCCLTNLSCQTNCCVDSTSYSSLKNRKHNGLDLFAPVGIYVHSISAGTIHNTGFSTSLGNYVFVETGTDFYRYNHLDEIFVKMGDRVKVGQILGTAGRSGNAANVPYPHLHLVVHSGSIAQSSRTDPQQFVTTQFDSLYNPINNPLCI